VKWFPIEDYSGKVTGKIENNLVKKVGVKQKC
jgi:hypothetical protein